MRRLFYTLVTVLVFGIATTRAQPSMLLPKATVDALDAELSGEEAKRNLEFITRLHRMRGSRDFKRAIEFITTRLKEYGLENVEPFQLPADGKTMYGTQKSRLTWEAEFAELWEMEKQGETWKSKLRLADWQSMPITLAEDSESGEVTAALVDVGSGMTDADYAGKDVKGKLVLISTSPGAVADLAVGKYGAAGMISYTQNQVTAWWKEDQNLIRWGHLETFTPLNTFCFMISLKQAADFRQRLAKGETIMLHATVKAGKKVGNYDFVTATIAGADPARKNEEIAFSCHLDHQRPGANDNASGSMTILEIARSMAKLIREGKIARPARTLRFIWSPEIEGTSAILSQRPEYATRIKAVIHMDMVGGGQVTKSIFHVAGAPKSLPSFVADVGARWGQLVNEESDHYASGYPHHYTFASVEGGKEPLQAVLGEFHMGSDHDVYSEGGYRIPAVYLHDWPDRYIHTNFDLPANIDPTKLKRAGFIGGASGYFLASMSVQHLPDVWATIRTRCLERTAEVMAHTQLISPEEQSNLWQQHFAYERGVFTSMRVFAPVSDDFTKEAEMFYTYLESAVGKPKVSTIVSGTVYRRNPAVKGPVSVFGYDYLADHIGKEKTRNLKLNQFEGLWSSSDYTYEALNFVDGKKSVMDIRNALSAEFGPVPIEIVDEYLKALETAGIIQK